MQGSILNETAMGGILASHSTLRPNQKRWKKSLAADLLLTALIDAFSILVIFLLMSFSSTGEILFMNKNMELPKASLAEILERNIIVKLDVGKIFLEEKEVTVETLIAQLIDLKKQYMSSHPNEDYPGIATIQADKKIKYESLNQIILAMAHAGYSDVRFAVVMK